MNVRGETNLYGYTVGILVNEMYFPRLPGAIGNATTFPFPVLQKPVPGASSERVVREPDHGALQAAYIEAARELVRIGAKAITTSCGFAATFQREMADALDVPVFASSLLLVPLMARMLSTHLRVGVVTADSRCITERHYQGAGIDPERVVLAGMEGQQEFEAVVFGGQHELNVERMQDEVVGVARRLVAAHPEVRALLLECSLLPPFARAVQEATMLPVFDFTTLVTMVHSALVRRTFQGYL